MVKTKKASAARRVDHKSHVNLSEDNMRTKYDSHFPPTLAIELFQPDPNVLYSLDAIAHLADVSRRSILVYCRAGLLQPVFREPYDVMAFTEDAVHTVRRIEHVRAAHGLDVAWIKVMFDLLDEVDSLRAEVRFLRKH